MNISLVQTKNKSYKLVSAIFTLLLSVALSSCSDDFIDLQAAQSEGFTIVGDPVEVSLNIAVSGICIDVKTRAEEPTDDFDGEDTEEEQHVDDLWVFEYSLSSGKLIYTPQHVTITDQSQLTDVQVTLSDNFGKAVVIYVVANAGSGVEENSAEWIVYNNGTESYDGCMTIQELEANTIPTPHPQRMSWDGEKYVLDSQDAATLSIPMAGSVETTIKEGSDVLIPVERMFAKVLVRVDLSDFSDDYESAWLNTITIGNIPEYTTVGTLWDGKADSSAAKADYKNCERWLQRRFNSIGETSSDPASDVYPYIIYVPENIQGENGSDDDKANNIPSSIRTSYATDALSVTAGIYVVDNGSTQGEYNSFVAYPGGDTKTNFNVRRNCLYRVTLKITNLVDDILPSANCIICLSGETTAFFPYCRDEIGGGYEFKTYLDADDETGEKKISYVKIIWQSTNGGNTVNYSSSAKGYIGDNSNNDYVWIDDVGNGGAIDEYHRRIHVSILEGHTGNALVGAFNEKDEIIWSWHIWSRARENDPTTVNTKLYYTYDWDADGIYGVNSGRPRVAGYTIMNCNLGAMQDEPNYYGSSSITFARVLPTYGTMYQWGRKDPFPPIRVYPGSTANDRASATYDSSQTGNYFDNENNAVTIINTNDPSALFHSVEGTNREEFDKMIPLTIQNPTVFYAGTKEVDQKSNEYIAFANTYIGNFTINYPEPCDGNWMLDSESNHYNRLWGGLDPEKDMAQITKSYYTGLTDVLGDSIHLYDDYGEKSIFDPCPYGWRVSPPDLWLGFTNTGLNPNSSSSLNYNNASSNYSNQYGLTMYLTGWKEGESSFFPTQGVRAPDGSSFKVGCCGNYNNATSDVGDRVNTLHVHNTYYDFCIFENGLIPYHIKSTAGSLRCIRINSVQE